VKTGLYIIFVETHLLMKLISSLLLFLFLFNSCKKSGSDSPVQYQQAKFMIRMANGSPVLYSFIRTRTDAGEIETKDADMEGNVNIKIPVGQQYYLDVFDASAFGYILPLVVKTLPPKSDTSSVTITIPNESSAFSTFTGTAKNCDGSPVMNGAVSLRPIMRFFPYEYIIPIKNGNYSAALFFGFHQNLTGTYSNQYTIKSFDTGIESEDTVINSTVGTINHFNMTTCPSGGKLFISYTAGYFSNHINGGQGPYAMNFYCKTDPSGTSGSEIYVSDHYGARFKTTASGIGEFQNSITQNMYWGFDEYIPDNSKPSKLVFTRYDSFENGIVEGYLSMYAKKIPLPESLPIVAKFRLRRKH